MHCQQVATIVRYAEGELRDWLLPRLGRGEVYVASVTTEPGKGGHLLTSAAQLAETGQGLRIDRAAPVVTGGAYADGFLITMQAPGATSPGEVSLVYADRDQLTLETLGGWDPMGMRATHSIPMKITGDIPAAQVVGCHGGFRAMSVQVFAPLAHLGWSTCWLGAAAGALSRTVRMLRDPAERQRRDLESELLRTRLSRVRQRLDGVNALIQHALTRYLAEDDQVLGGADAVAAQRGQGDRLRAVLRGRGRAGRTGRAAPRLPARLPASAGARAARSAVRVAELFQRPATPGRRRADTDGSGGAPCLTLWHPTPAPCGSSWAATGCCGGCTPARP